MNCHNLARFEKGGVVKQDQPSRWSQLYDFLFGRKALETVTGNTKPAEARPPENIDYVREAARQAGERMEADKKKGTLRPWLVDVAVEHLR